MNIKALFPLALGLLAGCIRLEETTTINTDGSALIDMEYVIPEQTILHVRNMRRLDHALATAAGEAPASGEDELERAFFDPDEIRLRLALKKFEPLGLTVKQLSVRAQEAARQVKMQLVAQSIAKLSSASIFKENGVTFTRLATGQYELKRAGHRASQEGDTDQDADLVKLLSPIMGGYSVRLNVTTPGRILMTNAPRKGPNAAAWSYEFEQDPRALSRTFNDELRVVFDGQGLRIPTAAGTARTYR